MSQDNNDYECDVDIVYFGCRLCNGLFTDPAELRIHKQSCDGQGAHEGLYALHKNGSKATPREDDCDNRTSLDTQQPDTSTIIDVDQIMLLEQPLVSGQNGAISRQDGHVKNEDKVTVLMKSQKKTACQKQDLKTKNACTSVVGEFAKCTEQADGTPRTKKKSKVVSIIQTRSRKAKEAMISTCLNKDVPVATGSMSKNTCNNMDDLKAIPFEAMAVSEQGPLNESSNRTGERATFKNHDEVSPSHQFQSSNISYKERKTLLKELETKYQQYLTVDVGDSNKACYQCPKCPKKTHHVGFFNRHLVTCHLPDSADGDKALWKCDHCDFKADKKSHLVSHRTKHMKPFMCEICSRTFSYKRELKTHLWQHEDTKPLQCEFCDYSTRFQGALKVHLRKHTGEMLKCTEGGCNYRTMYSWTLRLHKKTKHSTERQYHCDRCSYKTNHKASMQHHVYMHEGKRLFKCSECSHRAISRHEIVKHMRSHTQEKLYFCDRCEYSTAYSSGLKVHLMQHLGLKPWQCSRCGFNTITKQRVHQHLASKHPNLSGNVINLGLKLQVDLQHYKTKQKAGGTVQRINLDGCTTESNSTSSDVNHQQDSMTTAGQLPVHVVDNVVLNEANGMTEHTPQLTDALTTQDNTTTLFQFDPACLEGLGPGKTIYVQSEDGQLHLVVGDGNLTCVKEVEAMEEVTACEQPQGTVLENMGQM